MEHVNNPYVIAQNDNMVSINSAIQVDLMGQVNAEVVKGMQFSGVGGQVDFIRGATMSKGGRASLPCLPRRQAENFQNRAVYRPWRSGNNPKNRN